MMKTAFLVAFAMASTLAGGGCGNHAPGLLAASAPAPAAPQLAADQASAADLLGTVLTGADGRALGTVSDLLVDGSQERVAFIGLRPSAPGEGVVAVPWTPLARGAAAKGGYAASRPASIAADLPFSQQAAADPAFLDVRRDLLGRPVLAAAGEAVGRLIDFDVNLRSGAIGYLYITNTEMAERGSGPRIIPWGAIADLDNQRAIVLSLDAGAVLTSPLYSLAAHRLPAGSAGDRLRG